jgi:hypothetical protein
VVGFAAVHGPEVLAGKMKFYPFGGWLERLVLAG